MSSGKSVSWTSTPVLVAFRGASRGSRAGMRNEVDLVDVDGGRGHGIACHLQALDEAGMGEVG